MNARGSSIFGGNSLNLVPLPPGTVHYTNRRKVGSRDRTWPWNTKAAGNAGLSRRRCPLLERGLSRLAGRGREGDGFRGRATAPGRVIATAKERSAVMTRASSSPSSFEVNPPCHRRRVETVKTGAAREREACEPGFYLLSAFGIRRGVRTSLRSSARSFPSRSWNGTYARRTPSPTAPLPSLRLISARRAIGRG